MLCFQNIQVFDQEGNLLLIVGQGGGLKGEFYAPIGLSCVQDRLYIADQFNGRVQVLEYLPESQSGKGSVRQNE